MNINSLSPAQLATIVWANATRNLSTEANTKTAIGSYSGTVPAGTVLDLRPAAGVFRQVQMFGDGSNVVSGMYDGTTFTNANGNNNSPNIGNNHSALGLVLKNISVGVQTVKYHGFDLV